MHEQGQVEAAFAQRRQAQGERAKAGTQRLIRVGQTEDQRTPVADSAAFNISSCSACGRFSRPRTSSVPPRQMPSCSWSAFAFACWAVVSNNPKSPWRPLRSCRDMRRRRDLGGIGGFDQHRFRETREAIEFTHGFVDVLAHADERAVRVGNGVHRAPQPGKRLDPPDDKPRRRRFPAAARARSRPARFCVSSRRPVRPRHRPARRGGLCSG